MNWLNIFVTTPGPGRPVVVAEQSVRRYLLFAMLPLVLFSTIPATAAPVKPGAQVLLEDGFATIRGKRVGLIANQTAMVNGEHLADLLYRAKEVKLVALFGPEHGLQGLAEDGVKLANKSDGPGGVTVYSLYGEVKQPTPEMLQGVELLLFDIQDIGSRFYTYISTLGLAMQAAAKAGIPFMVLDRPNPLGGDYLAGPLVEAEYKSFVGLYPIPVAHGLTVGELAMMIKGERFLSGLEGLELHVVKMESWQRGMRWPATGLPWYKTSPNIPDFITALLYPGICFFEATSINEGRGTLTPFQLVGAPRLDGDRVAKNMNSKELPGVRFDKINYQPRSIPGMASRPKYRDRLISGVRISITDAAAYQPLEVGMHLLVEVYRLLDKKGKREFAKEQGFNYLAGSNRIIIALRQGKSGSELISLWHEDVERFRQQRVKYLLY